MKAVIFTAILLIPITILAQNKYIWLNDEPIKEPISSIAPSDGFERINTKPESYAHWLRGLPLKEKSAKVYLFNGEAKKRDDVSYRVIDIDIGNVDLMQCADAAIRLRAEYLFSQKKYDSVHFNFTSGDNAKWTDWRDGIRPIVNGNKVSWVNNAQPDSSYNNFRNYLNTVFTYAGSYSLSKELKPVNNPNNIQIGDLFIQGGFPGHVIFVVDMAVNKSNGEKAIMLAQGFTPAQDVHILRNNDNSDTNPWYIVKDSGILKTPEWTFDWSELYRF